MNLETKINRELWQAVRRSYEAQSWSNAILDSIHFLSDGLRTKTGLQSDGTSLAGQALGGKAPKLRLNRLQTESEKNVQAGVEQLLRGLYQAVRNPRSHERVDDSQADADALILFADYLLRVIGHAKAVSSLDEFVRRALEKSFVPNSRYADLLVAEIPPRQRTQVALTVYQRKTEGDGKKLWYFFRAILAELSDEEAHEFFEAVSEELRDSSDETSLRILLQLLEPRHWARIDEVAKLRTENRLIESAKDGRYVPSGDQCLGGALATWSNSFWSHFVLKDLMMRTLLVKLWSDNTESQDYVLKYCFRWLDSLAESPPPILQNILVDKLNAGDVRFKRALDTSRLWKGEQWDTKLMAALESFQAVEPTPDDDIPF